MIPSFVRRWFSRPLPRSQRRNRAQLELLQLEGRVVPSASALLDVAADGDVTAAAGKPVVHGNAQFQTGPECSVDGNTETVTGTIVGVGNQDVTVVVNAEVTATFNVTNPAGKFVKGLSKTTTLTGTAEDLHPENGKVDFSVSVTLTAETGKLVPNDKFTVEITNVDFTSTTVDVYQNNVLVLEGTC